MAERLVLRRHPAAARIVAARAGVLASLREVLDGLGLHEADVPVLLPSAGQEAHLRPPRVEVDGLPGPLHLQTSPELCLKRLLCAGVRGVYALGPAFRGGPEELSTRHQPAFTMLEWYRPGDRLALLVEDVVALGRAVSARLGIEAPAEGVDEATVLGVDEAFERWAGVPLLPLMHGDAADFRARAAAIGWRLPDDADPAECFDRALIERVEPGLAQLDGWVFLHGYPAFGAALAALSDDDPPCALRVEAYLRGVEIANGYVELADADEHRRRWADERAARDDEPAPIDEAFLDELERDGLPACVGMALGVDRLLMALTEVERITDVLPLHLAREDG